MAEDLSKLSLAEIKDRLNVDIGNEKLLQAARRHFEGGDSDMLDDDCDIARKVRETQKLRREVEDLLAQKLNQVDVEIGSLRRECNHKLTKWTPDASGNNDSTTQCLACGKYL